MAAPTSESTARRMGSQAGGVLAAYPRLDVLVNNADRFWATRRVTADGLQHTLAVNHLTPFLLTGRLEASAPARIVTFSSRRPHHREARRRRPAPRSTWPSAVLRRA